MNLAACSFFTGVVVSGPNRNHKIQYFWKLQRSTSAATHQTTPMTQERTRVLNWTLYFSNITRNDIDPRPGVALKNQTTPKLPNQQFPSMTVLSARAILGCRKWGCNKWGLKGCLAALPGNRPKSADFALFLPFSPFSGGCQEHLGNPENGGKRPFSSDILGFP